MQLLQISHREVNAMAICNSLPGIIGELQKNNNKKERNCRKRGQMGSAERICVCELHIWPVPDCTKDPQPSLLAKARRYHQPLS